MKFFNVLKECVLYNETTRNVFKISTVFFVILLSFFIYLHITQKYVPLLIIFLLIAAHLFVTLIGFFNIEEMEKIRDSEKRKENTANLLIVEKQLDLPDLRQKIDAEFKQIKLKIKEKRKMFLMYFLLSNSANIFMLTALFMVILTSET